MGSSTNPDLYCWKLTLMQIMQAAQMIVTLPVAIVFILVIIPSLGVPKSSVLYQDQALKLNTVN
jgi:hypothetical protein